MLPIKGPYPIVQRLAAQRFLLLVLALILPGCSSALLSAIRVEPRVAPIAEPLFELEHYRSVQCRPDQDPRLVVVVAISGGGYRAANFALGSLLALARIKFADTNERQTNLLAEIDYLTTVSGGGLAAGALIRSYLSTQRNAAQGLPFAHYVDDHRLLFDLRADIESQLWQHVLNPLSLFSHDTRGDAVQTDLAARLLSLPGDKQLEGCRASTRNPRWEDDLTLGDVFLPQASPANPCTPYWIANATVYNNGAIFSFTPDALHRYRVSRYYHRSSRVPVAPSDPLSAYTVPLALGARASMNFPVAFPPSRLDVRSGGGVAGNDGPLYLSDGGLADNLGIVSALEILRYERASRRIIHCANGDVTTDDERAYLLVLVDAFNGSRNPVAHEDPPGWYNAFYDALSMGLAAARYRTQSDLTNSDAERATVVESAVSEGDVAVAYLL